MNGHRERGAAGSLLTAAACLVVTATVLASSVLVQWFLLIRHAEQAAELAALAGVTAAVEGRAPCEAAVAAAARNDAEVWACTVRGTGRRVVVQVSISVSLEPRFPGGPAAIIRVATAGT